jgi:hypothetical protein
MPHKAPTGEAARRARVVHGWAFRDHTVAEKNAILLYLQTGETEKLPTNYQKLDQIIK